MPKPSPDDRNDERSFTMRTDERLRGDLDALQAMLRAPSRADTIRRIAHLARNLLEADPERSDRVTVVDGKGKKRDVFV